MKLKDLIFEQEDQSAEAAKAINNAIISIDDSMHYGVFAKAIAHILKDEYGSHNFAPFMEVLHKELGIDESVNEQVKESFKLSDLTFDIASDLFGGIKPGHGVSFPTASDISRIVFSEDDFNQWKKYIMQKFGDVTIHLFPEEKAYINQVKIEDEKFNTAKNAYIQGKAAWLDKEREAGRSID